ncbi:LOW QUALITY PROTEIN: transmembrane channel-like protein [Procambarus clarkii]|uniref:LOW QUALITY PROTEIN: transmembrane channel-like protein n=1 Tax=Procambarus clarkii TaxID=6728 RepID=UPI003742AF13
MTTSSGETVVEVEESTADEVAETLRIHKEVLAGVNQQPWPIARKLRLARSAREYIQRHEGELEERLAQSSSTKDVLLRHFIRVRRVARAGVRAVYLWVAGLEPWQGRIKTIESHFGSAVASYFTFLRWVLGLNVALTALFAAFVIIPEFLASERSAAGERKSILREDRVRAYDFKVMWDFEGVLRYSPVFYGYYSKIPTTREGYRLPLAYFLTSLAVYAYSFIAILRKMAANSRMSKLAEDEECTFAWRLLAGWDFTIGNLEAAQNKVAAINTGFRESLLEAKELEKEEKSWKLRVRRVLAHLIVLLLIMGSAYAVVLLVKRSEDVDGSSSWYRQNELTITLTLISMVYPNIFDVVGLLEVRHPRNQLQWQLGRIMALNLLNLYTLIFALFSKVDDMDVEMIFQTTELGELKTNLTETYSISTTLDFTMGFSQTTPLLTDDPRSSWFSYIDSTDASNLPNALSMSMHDVLNASLPGINNSLVDLLTTASWSLPPASPDPATLTAAGGQHLSHGATLATSLLAAAAFTGIPLSKSDPSLKEPLPPHCHLVPHPCLMVPSISDVTTPTPTEATVAPTTTSKVNTGVTPLTTPTTLDYEDWLRAAYDKVTEDPAPDDEGAIYIYDDDNITTNPTTVLLPGNTTTLLDSPRGTITTTLPDSSWGTTTTLPDSPRGTITILPDSPRGTTTILPDSPRSTTTTSLDSPRGSITTSQDSPQRGVTTSAESSWTTTIETRLGNESYLNSETLNGTDLLLNSLHLEETLDSNITSKDFSGNDATAYASKKPFESTESVLTEISAPLLLDETATPDSVSREIFSPGDPIDHAESLPLTSERNGNSNEALEHLLRAIPGIPARFNTLFLDYASENGAGQSDETINKHSLDTNDSPVRRMKREILKPYPKKREMAKEVNEKKRTRLKKNRDFNNQGENREIRVVDRRSRDLYKISRGINGKTQEQGGKNRVKRVINDYEGLSIHDLLDSPRFKLETDGSIDFEPHFGEENKSFEMKNEALKTEAVNDLNVRESVEADQYSSVVPGDHLALTTHDRASYWDTMLKNLNAENGNASESLTYEDGAATRWSTEHSTRPATWRMAEMGEPWSLTSEPEDDDCYIIVCDAPTEDTTLRSTQISRTAPTSPVYTSSATAPLTSVTPTSPAPTEASEATVTATDFVSSISGSEASPPPLMGPESQHFLVQPMKNNPEKWAPLLPSKMRQRLRKLCWETMFGQEIIKLTVMDMVVTVVTIVIGDYIRAVIVRVFNNCCCWDLEKQFPGYPDFKIAENILHLVNNQGMVWMGMFFSPGLPALNTFKLVVLLYVRSWAVVTSNVPPETVFKASNNNNFYLLFLLTMLFLCTLPVGYAVVWLEPSWHCGPFSDYPRIYQLATSTLIGGLPTSLYPVVDYISSPGVVIPAGLLLVLIIYYLLSLTAALREANSDLRDQLRHERSAEKRKALDARSGIKGRPETPTTRWGRVVPLTPMPRARLDATSDPEKPIDKKSSLTGDIGPLVPLPSSPRGKDDGSWPDDGTDLGQSEVFDDSLSEPRRAGKDTPTIDSGDTVMPKQEARRHDKRKEVEKERGTESAPRSPYSRPKNRRNSSSHGIKDEDEISLSKIQRGRHRSSGSQHKSTRMSQKRKESDDSGHRDSSTSVKAGHRQSIDSPKERRKGSGPQTDKLKHNMPQECVQELNKVLQNKELKQGRSTRLVNKVDPQKTAEPDTPTKVIPPDYHRRESSILKIDDFRRNSQGKNNRPQNGTQPGHQRSSSEDSQSMQTIPIIKISKEDSVERSLQQAKLERQEKMQEDPCTTSDQQSLNNKDTVSFFPAERMGEELVKMKNNQPKISRQKHSKTKSVPKETDLDDPYILDYGDPNQTSDTAALLGNGKMYKENVKQKAATEVALSSGTLSSDEDATLLD